MAATPEKPSGAPRSADQIETNLRASLETARDGLKQFWESIQESKMAFAVQQYRTLQAILIQQRLWAHNNGRTALAPVFAEIARTAQDLHRVFHSYAEIMRALKELDRITTIEMQPDTAPPGQDDPPSAP